VRPQSRRRGLAAALVSGSLARARARECRRIELDVNLGNPAAMALYEGFGFSAWAEVPGGENLLMRRGIEGG